MSNLHVGDQVYIGNFQSTTRYLEGIVTKITPTGYIDVKVGYSNEPTRFKPNGDQCGTRYYYGMFIDTIKVPFAERTKYLREQERIKIAVAAINDATTQSPLSHRHVSKEDLLKLVTELEVKVAEARQLTEAI